MERIPALNSTVLPPLTCQTPREHCVAHQYGQGVVPASHSVRHAMHMHLNWKPFWADPNVTLNVVPASASHTLASLRVLHADTQWTPHRAPSKQPAQSPCPDIALHASADCAHVPGNPKVLYRSDMQRRLNREAYEKGAAQAWILGNHMAVTNDGCGGDVTVKTHLWLNSRMDAEKAKLDLDMMVYPSYLIDLAPHCAREADHNTVTEAKEKKRPNEADPSRTSKRKKPGNGAATTGSVAGKAVPRRREALTTHSEQDLVNLVHERCSSGPTREALKRILLRHNIGLTVDLQKDLVTYLYDGLETESQSRSSDSGMQLNVCMDIDTAMVSATRKPIAADFHSKKDRTAFLEYCTDNHDELVAFDGPRHGPTLSRKGLNEAENIARSDEIKMLTHENDIVASNRLANEMRTLIDDTVRNFAPLSFVELQVHRSLHTLFKHDPTEIFSREKLLNWFETGEAPAEEFLGPDPDFLDAYVATQKKEINTILRLIRAFHHEEINPAQTATKEFKVKYGNLISHYWIAMKIRLKDIDGARRAAYMMLHWNSNRINNPIGDSALAKDDFDRVDFYETVMDERTAELDLATAKDLDTEMETSAALLNADSSNHLAPIASTIFNHDIDMFALASRILAMRKEFQSRLREVDGTPILYEDLERDQQALVMLYQTASSMVSRFVNSRTYVPFAQRWYLKGEESDADLDTVLEELLPQAAELTKSGTWTPELDIESYQYFDPRAPDDSILIDKKLMRQAMREVTGWLRPAEV